MLEAMAVAKIVYSEDGLKFGLVAPDGSEFEEQPIPDEGAMIIEDPDNGKLYQVTLSNYPDDGLEPDTVYVMTACETEVEGDEDEDEEEDEIDPTLADAVSE